MKRLLNWVEDHALILYLALAAGCIAVIIALAISNPNAVKPCKHSHIQYIITVSCHPVGKSTSCTPILVPMTVCDDRQ